MASKGTEFTSEAKRAGSVRSEMPGRPRAVRSRPGGCTQRAAYQS